MLYYGFSLSPNLSTTDEGYLIALNVPIARTGVQKYLPSEVPVENIESYIDADGMIPVYREAGEVFSSATIASFQGKPVTEGHPSGEGLVDTKNEAFLGKGHMENVRHGSGEYADNLVADVFITDMMLVDTIKSDKKREVSCGYTCDWVPENGKIYQRNIRGNHLAVVPRGRAGSDVAIHDNAPPSAGERRKYMAKNSKELFQHIFGAGLKEYAKDAEPEELAEAAKLGEAKEPESEPPKDEEPPAAGGGLEAKIDKLIEVVGQLVQSDKPVHTEVPEDAMDALDAEMEGEDKPENEPDEDKDDKSKSIGDDCEEGKPAGDSAAEFVKRMKPIVAKMPKGAARDEAAKELLDILKGGKKEDVYGGIVKAAQTHSHDEKPAQPKTITENASTFAENCKALRGKEEK